MKSLNRRGVRWAVLVLVLSGWMSMGALSQCDPKIAGQILDGVGQATASVASTLVQAAFQLLKPPVRQPVNTTTST